MKHLARKAARVLVAVTSIGLLACTEKPDEPTEPQLTTVIVAAEGSKTSLLLGETVQLTASGKDQNDQAISVPSFTWSTSNAAVATVNANGLVTPVGSGTADITATGTGDKKGTISITVSGSLHTVDITTSQTWKASDNPHIVRGEINVEGAGSPELTIEPGVIVKFEANGELWIGYGAAGALKVNGTTALPVTFTSSASSPAAGNWAAINFGNSASSTSTISNATIEYCGKASFYGSACLFLEGSSVTVNNVTIRNSASRGVQLRSGGKFGTGSSNLSVQNAAAYPVSITANFIGTIPTGGTFTSNAQNLVNVEDQDVTTTQTWPNLGIPYLMNGEIEIEGSATPVVTIPAGSVYRFATGASLFVGYGAAGGLNVNGTTAAPVLFTADATTPTAGHWEAINFASNASSNSSISNATIEYCGRNGFYGAACLNIVGGGSSGLSVALTNVKIRQSSGMGIQVMSGAKFGAGSTNVTVENAANFPIAVDANSAGTLPTGGTFTNNTVNQVRILDSDVTTTQTWPNLGIPYLINDEVDIEGTATPILTLLPGTNVRFTSTGSLFVGYGQAGGLQAVGTTAAPITFTANAASPAPGHWEGLSFATLTTGTLLDHTVVEYGGKSSFYGSANILIAKDVGAIVTNSVIRNSSGCGITRVFNSTTPWTTDFTAAALGNTFSNNATGNQCGP
jgi:hypothetical protein